MSARRQVLFQHQRTPLSERDLWDFPYHINRAALNYKVEKERSRPVVLPGGGLYRIFLKIRFLLPLPTPPLFFKYNSNPHTVQWSPSTARHTVLLLTVGSTGYKVSFNLITLFFNLCPANTSSLFLHFSLQLCSSLLVHTTISKT